MNHVAPTKEVKQKKKKTSKKVETQHQDAAEKTEKPPTLKRASRQVLGRMVQVFLAVAS